jgi:hypothetical protein
MISAVDPFTPRPSRLTHPIDPPSDAASPPILVIQPLRLNPPHAEIRAAPPRSRYLVHGVLPVVLGAAVYVLFRSPRLRVFGWLEAVGLGDVVPAARAWARPAAEHLPGWLLYSAPDGLWVYGLTACLALVWRGAPGRARRAWLCAGLALGAGGELGQLAGWVPGVWDPADLLLSAGAWGAAIVLNLSGARNEEAARVGADRGRVRRAGHGEHGRRLAAG